MFNFKSKPSNKPNAETLKTSSAVQERIKNILGIKELQSMPAQAAIAFRLANDPNTSLNDFVKIIESDEALASRILRIANSVFFYRGKEVRAINEALEVIGLTELRSLLMASMIKCLLGNKDQARDLIWQHSLAVAIFSRKITQKLSSLSPNEAFLAGLLHDIGKLVICTYQGGNYQEVIHIAEYDTGSYLSAEEKALELNHVEVGLWAAQYWRLPSNVLCAIKNHHDLKELSKVKTPLGTIEQSVMLADIFAHNLGVGHKTSNNKVRESFSQHIQVAFERINLSPQEGAELLESWKIALDDELSSFELELL